MIVHQSFQIFLALRVVDASGFSKAQKNGFSNLTVSFHSYNQDLDK